MSEVRDAVAAGIRSQRAHRLWTQRTLARRLGWSQATLSAAELGKKGFGIEELFQLAEAFDITVATLFRDAPESIRRRLGLHSSA